MVPNPLGGGTCLDFYCFSDFGHMICTVYSIAYEIPKKEVSQA